LRFDEQVPLAAQSVAMEPKDDGLPWGKIAIGVAAVAVVAGGVYYVKKLSEEPSLPKRSEEDILAERYIRRLQASGAYSY
jgi:hypothetical protein